MHTFTTTVKKYQVLWLLRGKILEGMRTGIIIFFPEDLGWYFIEKFAFESKFEEQIKFLPAGKIRKEPSEWREWYAKSGRMKRYIFKDSTGWVYIEDKERLSYGRKLPSPPHLRWMSHYIKFLSYYSKAFFLY